MLGSLEEAYSAQQRFVSDASHELRAPLTSIRANLELLDRQRGMSEEEAREALGELRREAERLTTLVGDLLVLARADARVPLRRQRVELDRVLLDAFGQAQHLSRGQEFAVEDFEPALVEGDPDRLKQLFLILLDNAIKYTPPGGKVSVTLRALKDASGDVARVSIRDTGVGIPQEAQPHVFERFFRADPARARDPGGTGLGLPIAQWIAEQHGGEISLASAVGRGTTVTVKLPIAHG
jgi:signal transduction histidine kinase